jgi:hypothetical protein
MSDSHNELTNEFVQKVVRTVLKDGGGNAELMVVLESIILGVMHTNVAAFGMTPQVSVGMTEACLQQAIERFTGGTS